MSYHTKMVVIAAWIFVAVATYSAYEYFRDKKTADAAAVASPACAELQTLADPDSRPDLQKRCPRSGPGYVPSPKVEW